MRTVLSLGLCLLLGSFPLTAQDLKVSFFLLPPHISSAVDADAAGPAINYLKDLGTKMGTTFVFDKRPLPLPRLLKYMKDESTDVILFVGKNPEREGFMTFPETPFYEMKASILVPKNSPLTAITKPEDLMTLTIGTYEGGYLVPTMTTPGLKLVPLSGDYVVLQNVKKMLGGRLSAVYSPDEAELAAIIKSEQVGDKVKILTLPDKPVGLYTTFSKKVDPAVVKKYQAALAALGSYSKYLAK